jgi:hypothetical protein
MKLAPSPARNPAGPADRRERIPVGLEGRWSDLRRAEAEDDRRLAEGGSPVTLTSAAADAVWRIECSIVSPSLATHLAFRALCVNRNRWNRQLSAVTERETRADIAQR